MEDPYISVESLDEKAVDYAKVQTIKFKDNFGCRDKAIQSNSRHFNSARRALQAIRRSHRLIILYQEDENFYVTIDGFTIFSTKDIISWIDADDEGKRVGIFITSGSDNGTLKIFDEGKEVDEIRGVISSILFFDSSYYIVKTYNENPPPDGGVLNSHRVLKDGAIVFGHGLGSNDFISLHKTRDNVIISVGDWTETRLYSGEIAHPDTWKLRHEISVPAKPLGIVDSEVIYLEQRKNGAIMKGDNVILEGINPIEDCLLVKEGLFVVHLVDAKISPVIYDFNGNELNDLKLNGHLGLKYLDSDEFDALIIVESFGLPYALYSYENGQLTLIEENKLLDLEVKERWVQSNGTRIHFFQINPVNVDSHNVLAYGYGGFNISLTPMYAPLFATLLQEGNAVVVANLRGGGEFGEEWHKSGMQHSKQNVFDDFISVISFLKDEGKKVVAMGASNGGLLVGTILTQRPDLLVGAVIGNPVLDMMRFHLMYVGKYWTSEYGNPDNQEDAAYLAGYSPYHNIRDGEYPPTLIYTRLNDDRVHPAHALKFHMKLSEVSEKVYLRANSNGGHIGIPPSEMLRENCETVNFIQYCFG